MISSSLLNWGRLEKELARLERNKDRRIARDKQKGLHTDGAADSPISPQSPTAAPLPKAIGTQRKCANCGQVGHIKTNKKYCISCFFVWKFEIVRVSAYRTRCSVFFFSFKLTSMKLTPIGC